MYHVADVDLDVHECSCSMNKRYCDGLCQVDDWPLCEETAYTFSKDDDDFDEWDDDDCWLDDYLDYRDPLWDDSIPDEEFTPAPMPIGYHDPFNVIATWVGPVKVVLDRDYDGWTMLLWDYRWGDAIVYEYNHLPYKVVDGLIDLLLKARGSQDVGFDRWMMAQGNVPLSQVIHDCLS